MNMAFPKNTILLLSGVPCVGKTAVAYRIIQRYPHFRGVGEMDIIRTIVRSVIENLSIDGCLISNIYEKYNALFKSITVSDLKTVKLQSETLIPYVKEIILRQQRRNIPTILEGAGIIPSSYYPNKKPLPWLTKTVIFVNLYLSSEEEHINRRKERCLERGYSDDDNKIENTIHKIRKIKNECLHYETLALSKKYNNVFSIDVSNMSIDNVVDYIIKLVMKYYNS